MPLWRKRHRFHGLKRPKIRQDMKKENLFNISRMRTPFTENKTFFQQKWAAKAMTRAYHGEQMREQQWNRMFQRFAHAVVPMNPDYLARNDGSEEAAGRGSGLDLSPSDRTRRTPAKTPYMQMVYHPTERRLDTAIFRALFASSARQARQFVTHGHVKVNGKLMRYPGYLLNPGDMFQVEPERVMFGTGTTKNAATQAAAEAEEVDMDPSFENASAESAQVQEEAILEEEEEDVVEEEISEDDPLKDTKRTLKQLRLRTKELLSGEGSPRLSAKQKIELRGFAKQVRASMSKASSVSPSDLDDLSTTLQSLSMRAEGKDPQSSEAASTDDVGSDKNKTEADQAALQAAIKDIEENPHDLSKPYATPWSPRPFFSAFAFIPRYLEVNQKICSAVYLRHPVCYPGFAEVPTPFAPETGQLAYNWYLRRR